MAASGGSSNDIFMQGETQIDMEGDVVGGRKASKHPYAVIFHLLFKVCSVIAYMFCGFFGWSFVTDFVLILFLVSADFWTTKNVTGRLLVGLRWWNYVDDAGKSHWVYESRGPNDEPVEKQEAAIFWTGLIAMPVVWSLFGFIALLHSAFRGCMYFVCCLAQTIIAVALSLSGSNLYGYLRCRLGKSKTITGEATNFLGMHFIKNMFTSKNAATNLAAAATAAGRA